MTIFLSIMIFLVVTACAFAFCFDHIYPYFFRDKYKRKIAKIVCQPEKPMDIIIKELWEEKRKNEKEKVLETRKKKLKRLNKV